MADDPVVRRIERALGAPDLVDALAALPATGGEAGYYVRTCFRLWSDTVNLADGGFTDWWSSTGPKVTI